MTKQVFTTETGQQPIIDVRASEDVTIGLLSGGTDIIDIEILLSDEDTPTRYVAKADVSGNTVRTFEGPLLGVGVNIKTNNSNDITFEVLAAKREG